MRHLALLLLALAVASAVGAPLPFAKPRKSDAQALQGEWVAVRRAWQGMNQVDCKGQKVSFSGSRVAFFHNGEMRSAWDFTLDPTKSPKHMDLAGVGTALLAIYQVEGDTLSLSYGGEGRAGRPAGLDGGLLTVYRRKR